MLKKNDEKKNGFLFIIVLPFLLFGMSYYGSGSSYAKLKTPEFLFSSVYPNRGIPNFMSVYVTDLVYSLINKSLSLQFLTLLNIFILPI